MLLSFDYPFFNGMYMGFGVTFLTIWGLTLPIITSCITIITAFIQIKNKERISILEKLCAFFGVIILLIYLLSAVGLLKHLELGFIYAFIIIGTLFILISRIFKKKKTT
jgi:hypothetical protein